MTTESPSNKDYLVADQRFSAMLRTRESLANFFADFKSKFESFPVGFNSNVAYAFQIAGLKDEAR